jgi:hypothetical protein
MVVHLVQLWAHMPAAAWFAAGAFWLGAGLER